MRVQALIDTSSAAILAKLRWVLRTLAEADASISGLAEQSAFETIAECVRCSPSVLLEQEPLPRCACLGGVFPHCSPNHLASTTLPRSHLGCTLTFRRYNERVREPTAKARGLRSKVEGMPTSFAALFNSFVPKGEAQGKLSRSNLQRLLKEYLRADLATASTDISAIMRLGDLDGDGMLSFPEFIALFVAPAYQLRDGDGNVVEARPVTLRSSGGSGASKDGGLELLYWQRPDLIPPDPPGFWSCPSCSLLNDDWRFFCKACMTPKPARLASK